MIIYCKLNLQIQINRKSIICELEIMIINNLQMYFFVGINDIFQVANCN